MPDIRQEIRRLSGKRRKTGAFTLVELLVASTLLIIVIGLVLRMTNQTSKVWRSSNSRIQSFQEARGGFESMSNKLGQATLKTYFDYYDSSNTPRSRLSNSALSTFQPATYDRLSDLHFISGQAQTLLKDSPTAILTQTQAVFFQAPTGYSTTYSELDAALNACGYFLQFDDADEYVPDYIKNSADYQPRYRMRLMEMTQATENLAVYTDKTSTPSANTWFVNNAASNSRILAENVIALVLLPKLSDRDDSPSAGGNGVSLAPNYNYNSRIPLASGSDPLWPSANPAFPGDSFTSYPESGGISTATRHHQLPPIIRVVMVVIDETSAKRIQGSSTTLPASIDFRTTGLFRDASKLDEDLARVEDVCNAEGGNVTGNTIKLNYQIFSTDILMREAKWSNN